jgi:hypothetical protein
MNTDWNSNSNNSNAQPETVEDFIDLLIAVKAKYGNLKVRHCNDAEENCAEEYYHFDDIVVNQEAQSLIRSGNTKESYLVFVV